MGLTGTILAATIRLRRVETGWIQQRTVVASDLTAAIATLDAADDATYSVAWIDCVARGSTLGRSLVFLGEHASRAELRGGAEHTPFPAASEPRLTVPFELPNIAFNRLGRGRVQRGLFPSRRTQGQRSVSGRHPGRTSSRSTA